MIDPFDRDHVVAQMQGVLPELELSSVEQCAALTLGVQVIDLLESVTRVYQQLGLSHDRVVMSKAALAIAARAMVAAFPEPAAAT